tara:strand:+ start:120 stop:404 length:285 start_codon:yes stop_codon:yes gene_type:complete
MPLDSKGRKVLYKPFKGKSTPANKKFSVYVKSKSGGVKTIHFGAKGMDDWRSGKATKEQRKSFRARMAGIKKKDGTQAIKDKNSPAYWAYNYLW